jgi:hypothetical protein
VLGCVVAGGGTVNMVGFDGMTFFISPDEILLGRLRLFELVLVSSVFFISIVDESSLSVFLEFD